MSDAKWFLSLALITCLLLTGCAVKRPVVIKVFPDEWVVRCPSDPHDDGAWWRNPSDKEAKEYCEFWHKWNHDNKIHRKVRR